MDLVNLKELIVAAPSLVAVIWVVARFLQHIKEDAAAREMANAKRDEAFSKLTDDVTDRLEKSGDRAAVALEKNTEALVRHAVATERLDSAMAKLGTLANTMASQQVSR